jgi:CheY-like chemotaxis protein
MRATKWSILPSPSASEVSVRLTSNASFAAYQPRDGAFEGIAETCHRGTLVACNYIVPTNNHTESVTVLLLLSVASPKRSITPILEESGFAIVSAPNGAMALELVRDLRPDVVMIDAELPDMTGLDVCRIMRGDPAVGREVPIILLLPDKPTPEQRVNALRAGVWDFMRVPGDRAEILLKLRTCMEAKRNIDAARADGFTDISNGLYNQSGLTRRAGQLGALMARMHAPFACVVLELDIDEPEPEAGSFVARAARASDVVGQISPNRFGVLAPTTDGPGAVLLANRIVKTFGELIKERSVTRGVPIPRWSMRAGYDAVSNAMYSPIDPGVFIARAATAMRRGTPERGNEWVRRYSAAPNVEVDHPNTESALAAFGLKEPSR